MYSYLGLLWLSSLVASAAASQPLILTPYINENKTQLARQLSSVDPSLFLGKESFSGFFNVDEQYNSNIFFWYFPVANKIVEETPWIVWLQGGPGASSLAGLFDEIGPFEYDPISRGMKERKYAWTKEYSILFVDNPIGAGFSFTDSPKGFARDIETCTTHLMEALSQFMKMFPELTHAPLYLAGESYAGIYVPKLALRIHRQDNVTKKLHVKMEGIILGTPLMDRISASNYTDTYFKWGLIDQQGVWAIRPLQYSYVEALYREDAIAAYDIRPQLLDKLGNLSQKYQMFNVMKEIKDDELMWFVEILKDRRVKEALHVGSVKFTFSNGTSRNMLAPEFLLGGGPDTVALLDQYKVLLYCGVLDLLIPCVDDAHHRRETWWWSKVDEFNSSPRIPWLFKKDLAGYSKSGGHLTEMTVNKAGHLLSLDKPAEVYAIVTSFIENKELPAHPDFIPMPEDTPDISMPFTPPPVPPTSYVPTYQTPKPNTQTSKKPLLSPTTPELLETTTQTLDDTTPNTPTSEPPTPDPQLPKPPTPNSHKPSPFDTPSPNTQTFDTMSPNRLAFETFLISTFTCGVLTTITTVAASLLLATPSANISISVALSYRFRIVLIDVRYHQEIPRCVEFFFIYFLLNMFFFIMYSCQWSIFMTSLKF